MGLHYKNSGIKLKPKPLNKKLKNVTSLLDMNMKVKKLKHDIVLNIRFDGLPAKDFFKYFIEKPLIENFELVDPDYENSINKLPVNRKSKVPVFSIDNKNTLTIREIEIMEKLSEGLLYKEIADSLGLSLNTVKNHLKNIYPKLGAGNRSEAIIEYLIISDKIKKY